MKKDILRAVEYALIVILVKTVFSMFLGKDNIVLGILFTIGGILFLNRDFTEKSIFRFISFSILNIILAFIANVANLNNYVGLIINMIVIFFTIYIYMNDFRQATSIIFIMIYIEMYMSHISMNLMPKRIVAILLGIGIIILLQFIYNRNMFKETSDKKIKEIITGLNNQIKDILEEKYNIDKSVKIGNEIRQLVLKIKDRSGYILKVKKKDITKLNIGLCLCRLNLIISRGAINENKNNKTVVETYYKELQKQIKNIENFNDGETDFEKLKNELKGFIINMKKINKDIDVIDDTICTLEIFIESLGSSKKYEESILEEIYTNVNTPSTTKFIDEFIENFNIKSLRLRFSLKFAVSVSITLFVLSFLKIQHSTWVVLSICSVLQPYLEDSIDKGKRRILGGIIGGFSYILIFQVLKVNVPPDLVFFIGITGFFAFKDYTFRFAMMSIFAISISCMGGGAIEKISFERFFFVIIGTMIALIVDKIFLPYKVLDGIKDLEEKYKNITNKMLKEMDKLRIDDSSIAKVLELSIKRRRIENKMINISTKLKNKENERFIFLQDMTLSKGKGSFLRYYYLKFFQNNKMD